MASYDHWLPLHIGDYVADTMHLTTLQHGIYLLLIMHYFKHQGLPQDNCALARIARMRIDKWQQKSPTVMALFYRDGQNQWRHKRIDAEIASIKSRLSVDGSSLHGDKTVPHNSTFYGQIHEKPGLPLTRARAGASTATAKDSPRASRTPQWGVGANANGYDRPDRNAAFDVLREMHEHETTERAEPDQSARVVDLTRSTYHGKRQPH